MSSPSHTPAAPDAVSDNAAMLDEESAIKALTETVRDQDDLERDITYQAELALIDAEDKRDEKRIERLEASKTKLEAQRSTYQQRLRTTSTGNPALRRRFESEIAKLAAEIETADKDLADFRRRIDQRHVGDGGRGAAGPASATDDDKSAGNHRLPNETQREFLIRTGKITPFAKISGARPDGVEGDLADVILEAEDEAIAEELAGSARDEPHSHQNLRLPGFSEGVQAVKLGRADAQRTAKQKQETEAQAGPSTAAEASVESEFSLRPRKKRKTRPVDAEQGSDYGGGDGDEDEWKPAADTSEPGTAPTSGDESDDDDTTDFTKLTRPKAKKQRGRKGRASTLASETEGDSDAKVNLSGVDDGNEMVYKQRLDNWVTRRRNARRLRRQAAGFPADDDDDTPEWFKPSPDEPDHVFENGLRLPGDIYPSLFAYQKTAVRWLAELYDMRVGGIIGDEMGLGKTVQLISFVAALHYSRRLDKPVIVVAPATVLRQWVNEFHRWWPALRVSILHSSGSGMLSVKGEDRIEEEELPWDSRPEKRGSSAAAKKIVDRVVKHGHVLVTTYAGLQTYGDVLIPVRWGYAVLDEGHKIRNPNTAITVYCKELRTPNRIILSGTPMQNNLTELWSLFDFIYPMRLGTLINFRNQFEIPIRLGGYANATNLQIMTAQKCAETLKDAISPYLLQRLKADVATDLPKKSEQVLFCKLTEPQRLAYELFLKSDEMNAILRRARQSLYGIDILRKICNHPDLLEPPLKHKEGYYWGNPNKSGKMQVVKTLLQMWKRFGHKTLLFCQGTQMLDILEAFVQRQGDINYLRMDGKTAIKDRQTLVDRFNNSPHIDLFLLTTKVGGLGTNLTGANRVIIFDPDWNPSTDVQARERAWRLGQKKEVTIYRLMTAGTIEEKIYHRQIFKQFLTNKVLKDPKQRTTFGLHDLHDLFSLGSYEDGVTETSELFQGSEVMVPTGRKQVITPGPDSVPIITDGNKGKATEAAAAGDGDDAKQLRSMPGVAKLEEFQQADDDGANANANGETADTSASAQEDRIMKGIFAQSALHSAVEHDMIMNGGGSSSSSGKRTVQADRRILEQEARRVASEAAAHLRQAGEEAGRVPIGTVTWTGEVGEAGRPRNVRNERRGRAGPSSSGILASIADRQGLRTPTSRRSPSGTPDRGYASSASASASASAGITVDDFERMIPNFIRRHGGKVPSKVLVDHFNQYCTGKQQAADFKKALEVVARMEKTGSSMRAIWSLKPKFQQA
ncbi:DNA excision repair protein ERCC-6 [Sporothrix brasiliensis 5110]|uniref:DNA excision repair protein ERCC-6 n=1 Tax=Sporothrix brasiliensis 5110 TaxID=1398154 RepID=A0A0C2IN86_9PEZI|nr:DNA excision repair protein ERCC-6 [Sporothrix brasiliensis 5110]KIH90496.1 DNA excision repair protein ERCC-6 [Sporothrix brasiliensis 5110]